MGKEGNDSEWADWTLQELTEARKLISRMQDTLLEVLGQELGKSSQLSFWY